MPKFQLADPPSTRREWARRVVFLYSRSIEAIVLVGQALIDAKGALGHGTFIKMCKRDLPFKERQAQRYMQIARHPFLSKKENWPKLPASFLHLEQIAGWEPEVVEDLDSRGVIKPDLELMELLFQKDMTVMKLSKRSASECPKPSLSLVEAAPMS